MSLFRTSPATTDDSQMFSFQAEAISDNGIYVVGNDVMSGVASSWNTQTDDVIQLNGMGELHAVNNQGVAVGSLNDEMGGQTPIIFDCNTGNYVSLYLEENEYGAAWGVNADGSVVSGYYFDASWTTYACVWTENGTVRTLLPQPTEEQLGFPIDYLSARWMSADGSVILGYVQDTHNGKWVAIYWKYENDEYVVYPFGAEYFQPLEYTEEGSPIVPADPKEFNMFEPTGISANGNWITLSTQAFSLDVVPQLPARYNIATSTLEVLDVEGEGMVTVFGINNDGTCVGRFEGELNPETWTSENSAIVWRAGENEYARLADMCINETYPASWNQSSLCAIANTDNILLGRATTEDGIASFIISLDEIDAVAEQLIPTITVTGIQDEYFVGETATAIAKADSKGLNETIDQLCVVAYEIYRDGELVENVEDYGTIAYRFRIQGGADYLTGVVNSGSGIVAANIDFEGQEYQFNGFTFGIFDNSSCLHRSRNVDFMAYFKEPGSYTLRVAMHKAVVDEENVMTVNHFTACGAEHDDQVALNATAGDLICETSVDVVVLPFYNVTFEGLSDENVVLGSIETVEIDPETSQYNYSFSINLDACQNAIESVTVGESVLDAVNGVYTIENLVSDTTVVVVFDTYIYNVIAATDGNGTVSAEDSEVACGSDLNLVFTANNGYILESVFVDDVDYTDRLSGNALLLENIRSNHNVMANFSAVTGPYIEFAGAASQYNVGDSIEFSMKLHSNGAVDNLCSMKYKIIYENENGQSMVISDASSYGVMSYDYRLAGEDFSHNVITRGSANFVSTFDYNGTSFTANAYTLGLLDNDCVERNRNIDFDMLLTRAGVYSLEVSMYSCSNPGENIGSTFVAENCDGLTHYDRVSANCDNQTLFRTETLSFAVVGNTIYTVTCNIEGGHGTVSPEGTHVVNAGENFTFTFIPDENYALDTVMSNGMMVYPSVSGVDEIVDNVYEITNIRRNYNVVAKFRDIRPYYHITVDVETAGGDVTPRDTTVVVGSNVTLHVTPNQGYHISQLSIDNNIIANYALNTIQFNNVNSDHHVAISFFPNSIEDEMFSTLNVYPNPSNGNFSVSCEGFSGETTFQIYNSNASLVEEKTASSMIVDFDSNLPAGTYFLRIISGDKVATRKVVVE